MEPTDLSGVRTPPMMFRVLVDDNSASTGECRRYTVGEFASYAEAVAACREIVDEFFRKNCRPATSSDELYAAYRAFGEDPFITPDNGGKHFSAWEYARSRCAELHPPANMNARTRG